MYFLLQRQEAHGKKQITVLDPKRSNAINIGLTVLPPPRTIKAAILKMDNSIMNKEGIEVSLAELSSLSYSSIKSNRKAMNRNWSNQKANPLLKPKLEINKYYK